MKLLILTMVAAALALPAAAQTDKPADVSGAWALEIDTPNGKGTPTVTFKQDGEKLTGTYSSPVIGEHQLTGTIKGNNIAFGFETSFDGNKLAVKYAGTVEKDTMKGKVDFGGAFEGAFTGKKK
ncbi:MAG TPA: hypothetical protein VH740_03785 [Vicinamibacterales bacterium]